MLHSFEDRFDRVIIRLRDGIELVVVAARAANGQPEECAARGAHDVVQFVGALIRRQHRVRTFHLVPRAADEKPSRFIHAERIPGELFHDESVVGLVLVERANDVIAIRPGIRARLVHFEPVDFGEPHHIEPMPRPAFAVARRGQQLLDKSIVSIRFIVREKCSYILRRRRKANEIKIEPAD